MKTHLIYSVMMLFKQTFINQRQATKRSLPPLLYNENRQQCWWFQKALALHSPAAAIGSLREGAVTEGD